VVIPAEVRAELARHARGEAPNEACGLIVLRDGRAERYVPGRNTLESPYRFPRVVRHPELLQRDCEAEAELRVVLHRPVERGTYR